MYFKKVVLLGSGELGKELVIALKRLGCEVVAVDSYSGAPAMQVADTAWVADMLDGTQLKQIVRRENPDYVVPEIEAIRTEALEELEKDGFKIVPSARAVRFTMNRRAIRDLAAKELGLRTARFRYATSPEALLSGAEELGYPCVVKPLMSSSGKGQSVLRKAEDVSTAWQYAMEGSRGDLKEVIVEEFIDFDYEITLLTVTTGQGVHFCPPIGHRQEQGDYRESWQPRRMPPEALQKAQDMARHITSALGGYGIWGVEFFVAGTEVWFSELSPRPHDTGMVTLAGTQNLNEFELHARAFLGLPIPDITLERSGCSVALLAQRHATRFQYSGLEDILKTPGADIRIFGKPVTRPNRRMGVLLLSGPKTEDGFLLVEPALQLSEKFVIQYLPENNENNANT
ncbi:MAG: formate-dependent phosphoribosylglycinamide formyltransferase [Flavobacteriales bacterium]|nr:formate-dependent phosphoribosylglycinamide formyltransferase [Flavobacteriales bacterium]MDW8431494.1 formate-dependent phosphoribosylglycinamide formyltransferase [Flavobacteriales bacterium]